MGIYGALSSAVTGLRAQAHALELGHHALKIAALGNKEDFIASLDSCSPFGLDGVATLAINRGNTHIHIG